MPKRKKPALNPKYTRIKLGKSYTSLVLGLVIIAVLIVFGITLMKGKGNIAETSSISTEDLSQTDQTSFYIVKSGDSLWTISESIYQSGYNWVDIAKANKLENPGLIYAGTKLEIPKAQPKPADANVEKSFDQYVSSSITGGSYAVVKGDNLWKIAVRAYGDGYRWVDIAKANNLANPNIIHSGNVFKIPR